MELEVKLSEKSYKVVLQRGILNNLNSYYDFNNRKVLVITDDGVPSIYSEKVVNQISNSYLLVLKQGEQTKSIDSFIKIQTFLLENNFSRNDIVIALGGGVIGDLSAFCASTYKRGIYYALKKFTSYLEFTGELSYNPMEQITIPANKDSQKTIEKREKGFLTNEEISLVLRNVEKSTPKREKWRNRDRVIIEVFLVTGIRCSALYKLDVNSVDLGNCTLIVTDKGGKVKVCDMPEVLVNHMKEWLQDRENILGDKAEEALFISNRLKRVSKRNIEDIVHRYSDVLGRNISPHKLRATYGTRIYEETKDIVMVQECMGHANIETSRIYVRGKKNSIKQASEIMAQSIN